MGGHSGVCPAVVGPTAVGKTALVTALAARLPLEIISLDSRQIYRGLRIGTAQPTAAERAACPHHLVDFVDPDERYSAQRFRQDFIRAYQDVTGRGRVPLLVGGAGLYLKAVAEGLVPVPRHEPKRLARIRAELADLDDEEVRRRLARVDPQAHARIHPGDRLRTQRALEVFLLAGRTQTDLHRSQTADPALGLRFPVFVLTRDGDDLDARIAARTEAMLARGWIEETRALLGCHRADGPGLCSIGYREIVRYLGGDLPRRGLTPAIVRATRQYAKRQRTWFRALDARGRGHPDDPALVSTLLGILGAP